MNPSGTSGSETSRTSRTSGPPNSVIWIARMAGVIRSAGWRGHCGCEDLPPGRGRHNVLMAADERRRARLVGINHVALEVDDLEAALDWYGRVFEFELRGRVPGMAFLDMGDQFLAMSEGRSQPPDVERHFGLVVDDLALARTALEESDAELLPSRGLDFRDPWGNHVQVVEYGEIQFSKTAGVMRGLGMSSLAKTPEAEAELRDK